MKGPAPDRPKSPSEISLGSHLRKELLGFPPTLRLGQDGVSPPRRPAPLRGPNLLFVYAVGSLPVALSTLIETPGPIVELRKIFFM